MVSYINETDFVIENKKLVYPEIVTEGLQLYYDAKGKRDTDYHRDTMLDMSGNKNHGKLHNFAYEKHSGYKDGLVFDYIDDKLVRPALNLQPDDFTFMLNGNIISFSPDGTVKRVQDGEVVESKGFNMIRNGDFVDERNGWKIYNLKLISRENGIGKFETTSSETAFVHQPIDKNSFSENDLIYTSFDSYIPHSATSKYIRWFDYENITLSGGSSDSLTRWSGVFRTGKPHPEYGATIRHHAQGSPGTIIELGRYVFVNLTRTFGAGNEPTKEQMDEIIQRFGFIPNSQDLIDRIEYKGNDLGDMENIIDGLYKTEALSGEEVYTDKADDDAGVHVDVDGKSYQHAGSGKNLSHKNTFTGTVFKSSETTNAVDKVIEYNIPISPNSTYILSSTKLTNLGLVMLATTTKVNEDITGHNAMYSHVVSGGIGIQVTNYKVPVGYNYVTITTGGSFANTYYSVGSSLTWSNIQLEEGSTATAYEPPAPNPDYPIPIHSLNDFDVVSSVGRENLLSDSVLTHFSRPYIKDGDIYRIDTFTDAKVSNYPAGIKINASIFTIGKTYTLSFKTRKIKGNVNDIAGHSHGFVSQRVFIDGKYTSNSWSSKMDYPNDELVHELVVTLDFTGGSGDSNLYIQPNRTSGYSSAYILDIWDLKVEEGLGTPYSSPLSESIQGSNTVDKINLLLDEPLRSVGDVKDRLFRDNDGVWKIERNVGETLLGSTDIASISIGASNNVATTRKIDNMKKYDTSYDAPFRSTHHGRMKGNPGSTWGNVESRGTAIINTVGSMWLSVDKENIDTVEKAKNWFEAQKTAGTPVIVQYELETPTIEILDQELQDKLNNLRSFEDSNYVYTVIPNEDNYLTDNLKPTLHAKFLYNNWYKEDRVINNLMIYNRALTNEEMLQNYKTVKRRWGM